MSRIAYVNGRYLSQPEAAVNIEDRGYQFGDGIYEVVHLYDGRFVDEDLHLSRLERSLREIALPMPIPPSPPRLVLRRGALAKCETGCGVVVGGTEEQWKAPRRRPVYDGGLGAGRHPLAQLHRVTEACPIRTNGADRFRQRL